MKFLRQFFDLAEAVNINMVWHFLTSEGLIPAAAR
jgi:hypothetical protein